MPPPSAASCPSFVSATVNVASASTSAGIVCGLDRSRLADDEPGVQAVGGEKVRGLKLPVGEHAVDHFEAEREPLDGLERGGRIARPRTDA